MTQSPLGTTPGGSDVPADTPGDAVTYGGDRPYPDSTVPGGTFDDGASGTSSKVDTAKGEAKQVAGTAVDAGKEVAATAKDEASNVVAEAKQQAASLFDTVRSEAGTQVGTQQQRIAEALHSLSNELGGMASSSQESGPLTDLAHQASSKGGEVARWLQDREPADVLEAVRSYARRRPVTFLALCGVAGIVAGRLTRSTVANRTSLDSKGDTGTDDRSQVEFGSTYAATPATAYPATGPSTGVYGGSVETTASAPYQTETSVPGPGYGVDPNSGLR